jgi:epoxyqueuosine reductase
VSFATPLDDDAFRSRALLSDTSSREGSRALARAILMMDPADYAAAFRTSAIKRAKLWMLKRNACVALGNTGTGEDVALLEGMLAHDHEHPLVREHATWALTQLRAGIE